MLTALSSLERLQAVSQGVVTDPAMNSLQRVVPHQQPPSPLEFSSLRLAEPPLNVFSGRAGIIAGRHEVYVMRPAPSPRTGSDLLCQINKRRDVARRVSHKVFFPPQFEYRRLEDYGL